MKILALLFLLLIILVIVAADLDAIPPIIRDLYRFPNGDKLGHFILYGILGYLLARAFPRRLRLGRLEFPLVILILLVFVALEELSQAWFWTRSADIFDFAASCLGIALGTWLARPRK